MIHHFVRNTAPVRPAPGPKGTPSRLCGRAARSTEPRVSKSGRGSKQLVTEPRPSGSGRADTIPQGQSDRPGGPSHLHRRYIDDP